LKNLSINGFNDTRISVHAYELKHRIQTMRAVDLVCAEYEWMSTKRFVPTSQWLHAFSETKCQSHLLLVAGNASELVGWCRLFPEQCTGREKTVELGIGLLPDYRNQKIGSGLLQLAFQWAKISGVGCINLSVHKDNHRALHVFARFGFQYIFTDADRFLMSARVQERDKQSDYQP
jgi:RimJ/RimL family protein N-acetyltransferase